MPDLEFKLLSDISPVRDMQITANFDEVKAQLKEMLEPYESLIISEDDIASGKDVLARIRKVKTALDDYRKSVKRDFTAPLTEFEAKCKELTAVCVESETNLSEQLNKYAEQRKAKKLKALEEFFNENVGDMKPYLTFEQVLNPKWGNATYAMENAENEIKLAIAMCEDGVDAIRALNSEFEATLLTAYAKNRDLAATMKMNSELAETKRREDARRAAEEIRRQEAEAARKEAEAQEQARREAMKAKAQEQAAKFKLDDDPPPAKEPQKAPGKPNATIYTITFRVEATREQLVALKAACDRIGILIQRTE